MSSDRCVCGADTVLNYARMPPFPICVGCGEISLKCTCEQCVLVMHETTPIIESRELPGPQSEPLEDWGRHRCPYCLYDGPRYRFESVLKNGKTSRRLHCPDCSHNFYLSSDIEDKTIEQYVKWIIAYPAGVFWHQVNFELLKSRLYAYGIAKEFWDLYHALKPKSEVTSDLV